MDVKLEIFFDGNVQGLPEHRLSLSAFGKPLAALVAAARRIASNLVANAVEPDQQREVGRLASIARNLDIEIDGIKEGSTGLSTVLTLMPKVNENFTLFEDLPERTGMELLDAIVQESSGIMRNGAVRGYLKALPSGLTKQAYRVHRDGKILGEITIGEMELPELSSQDVPFLERLQGAIVGVGFEPGKNEVRIRADSGTIFILSANDEYVNLALQLRNNLVKALIVTSKGSRLLRLEGIDAPEIAISPEYVQSQIFDRWHDLLHRLAQ